MKTWKKMGRELRRGGRDGFTLIEIMLVIMILGMLAGVAVVAVKGKSKKGAIAATRITIQSVGQAVKGFEIDCGDYPNSLDELTSNPGNTSWDGPYLERPPKDAWGRALNYSKSDNGFTITSAGPDGSFGGGDDLTN